MLALRSPENVHVDMLTLRGQRKNSRINHAIRRVAVRRYILSAVPWSTPLMLRVFHHQLYVTYTASPDARLPYRLPARVTIYFLHCSRLQTMKTLLPSVRWYKHLNYVTLPALTPAPTPAVASERAQHITYCDVRPFMRLCGTCVVMRATEISAALLCARAFPNLRMMLLFCFETRCLSASYSTAATAPM